jgi:hypothetical protein
MSRTDPFAGTAQELVRQGIPAVVAMQFEISDEAAITFSLEFYRALADGCPVDAALTEARKAIYTQGNRLEWATPVLYMRTLQGPIFDVRQRVPPVPVPDIVSVPTRPKELDAAKDRRLQQLYADGLAAMGVEDWDKACRTLQALVDESPRYPDAAARLEEAKRQRKWHALYCQAKAAIGAGNWVAARSPLETLAAEAGDYKDAAALLASVRKQIQLADLYGQARTLVQTKQWQEVLDTFARLRALDPGYRDVDSLESLARRELATQQRQAQVERLYVQAVAAVKAGEWYKAREQLDKVLAAAPGHKDAGRLRSRVLAEIKRLEWPGQIPGTGRPSIPRGCIWVAVGATIATFCGMWMLAWSLGLGRPENTGGTRVDPGVAPSQQSYGTICFTDVFRCSLQPTAVGSSCICSDGVSQYQGFIGPVGTTCITADNHWCPVLPANQLGVGSRCSCTDGISTNWGTIR